MAQNPEAIAAALADLVEPAARGRLIARGLARGMIWRDGVVPQDGPFFAADLTSELLGFGYGVLALVLELRDANRERAPTERFPTEEGFRVASEALEAAVRRGDSRDADRERHLVVAAAALHLGGFAARSYSLLSDPGQSLNLTSSERALALLLRRQLERLRDHVTSWLRDPEHQDAAVAAQLRDPESEFGPEDAAVVALSVLYHEALGYADSALVLGDEATFELAVRLLGDVVVNASRIGNIPMWWTSTLTRHLLGDLWGASLNQRLPLGSSDGTVSIPPAWDGLRRDFIELLGTRHPPQLDLWPSQLEAAARAIDPSDARDKHNVLVYSPQRSQVEPLVDAFCKIHRQGYLDGIRAPDPKDIRFALAVGREWLGAEHPAVLGLSIGIGTHHGALPRPFLSAIEDLLNRRRLPIVVASPTLAQGIDLACGVLIFRSLKRFDSASKEWLPIEPTEFANVLGRAGRAYVDLDGIAVYPIFKSGRRRAQELSVFTKLIKDSREQRLVSGLAKLVHGIAGRIRLALDVPETEFMDYLLNHRELWGDERLRKPAADDEDGDERSIDDLLGDLDVAILSLVEDANTAPEQLAGLLDTVLQDSLWKRTLARVSEPIRVLQPEVLRSRAEFIWNTTTPEQRKACFSSGLGSKAGVFLYDRLDELVPLLVDFHAAVVRDDPAAASTAATAFATIVMEEPFFATKLPPNWEKTVQEWISGTAFADVLSSHTGRNRQKVQAFVQDGLVYRLVWAAEDVERRA